MAESKLIRTDLAYWEQDKTSVELYEDHIRFLPIGEKPINIKYSSISSCKRYFKELFVTSKGNGENGYDIHYVPVTFENRDIADYYFQFIVKHVEQFAQTEESENEQLGTSTPDYTIPTSTGFSEGILYIYSDHFSFRITGEGMNTRVHYLDVQEVVKSFGTIKIVLSRNGSMSFQIPKPIFQEVFRYLDGRVKAIHSRAAELQNQPDRVTRTGQGKDVDAQVIAESNMARGIEP